MRIATWNLERKNPTSPSVPSSRQATPKAGPTTSPATGSAITTGSSPTSSHNGPEDLSSPQIEAVVGLVISDTSLNIVG